MKHAILAGLAGAVLAAAALPASARNTAPGGTMTVQDFLAAADRIPRNATALVRSDTRRLLGETRAAFRNVRGEEDAARAAGRTAATCMPDRISLSPDAVLARFNAVPQARRRITVTQAVREWMADEHPCPR